MTSMRRFMRLVERAQITEIERGHDIDDSDLWEPISKAEHDPRQGELLDLESDYQPRGKFDGYDVASKTKSDVRGGRHIDTYALFRGGEAVAYIDLASYRDDRYQVIGVRVATAEQGKNLAPRFYRWLLTDGNITALFADDSQTEGGAKIWERLLAFRDVALYIVNHAGKRSKRITTAKALERAWETDDLSLFATKAR